MLHLPVAHSSSTLLVIFFFLLNERIRGRTHVRMSVECEMSVGGCNFLPFSDAFQVRLMLVPFQLTRRNRALTYYSRARLRNTRDRSIEKRSIESWIHVVFALRSLASRSFFCLRLGSLAMPDVVESNPSVCLLIFPL